MSPSQRAVIGSFLAVVLLTILLGLGVNRAESSAGPMDQPHRAASMPAGMEGHNRHGEHRSVTPAAAGLQGTPTVSIVSPAEGATVSTRNVEITFSTADFTVGPIGTPHIHFHLDDDPIPFMFFNGDNPQLFGQRTVFFDFDPTSRATWIAPDTVRFNGLMPGTHTLAVHLVDGAHNRLSNPEATVMLTFTVDVPLDDADPPTAVLFVKQQKQLERVFDNDPNLVGDLYRLDLVPGGLVAGATRWLEGAEVNAAVAGIAQLTDVAKNGGGVTDVELSWDGGRAIFAMRWNSQDTWHLYELVLSPVEGMNVDGTGLRQITADPPGQKVNDIDPFELPDGRIVFASDRLKVRDEYNIDVSTQIYVVNPDGTGLRLLDPNPSHSINPVISSDGRVIFDRWDHQLGFNRGTAWHMNQDGTSSFVLYGGASPKPSNVQGFERRELVDGQFVGIFTERDKAAGKMGIFDNRGGNLEDLPNPVQIGGPGVVRTPNIFTTYELIYSFSLDSSGNEDFGLYTVGFTPEEVLVLDTTEATAPGPGENPAFRTYTFNLQSDGRFYVVVSGRADDNGGGDDDDLGIEIDGQFYGWNNAKALNGSQDLGLPRTVRVDVDGLAGQHTLKIRTDETPTLTSVKIVRGVRGGVPMLLYNDATTFELHPVPVRARSLPIVFNSRLNPDLDYGTVIVRDISLRGDFRQANHDDSEGDPELLFHLDLDQISGLRVFKAVARRGRNRDVLVGSDSFEPVKILGLVESNATGSVHFLAPADEALAWHVLDNDGAALVKERIWSFVQPGEVRACGGCHVPVQPYLQRPIEPLLPPTDLRTEGEVASFARHILPILQQRCQSCHLGGSAAGGLDLFGDRNTFNRLREEISGRVPTTYVVSGSARDSFLFQLLTGNARGNSTHQNRLNAINASTDHTTLLTDAERTAFADWMDTGAGFIYLPDGEVDGPPRATNVNPRAGRSAVATNTQLVLEFSEAIDPATFNNSTFTLRPASGGAAVAGTVERTEDHVVTFRPTAQLSPNTTYRLDVTTGVRDVSLNNLAAAFSSTFTTGSAPDFQAPTVSATFPSPAAGDVPVNGPVSLTFSEVMNGITVDDSTFVVEVVATSRANSTATDHEIAPGALATSPAPSATLRAGLSASLSQLQPGQRVPGRIGLARDLTSATFIPDAPFDKGATYRVRLTTDVTDLAGNPLAGELDFTFTTAASPEAPVLSLLADEGLGSNSQKLAVTPDGSRILVANWDNDNVWVFDGTTLSKIASIGGVGDAPFDVAITPDGRRAYVVNGYSDDVRPIDLTTFAVGTSIGGLGDPARIAINPAGTRAYVTDIASDVVRVLDINPASGSYHTVIQTIPVRRDPYDVAITPDGGRAYVTGIDGVDAVDLETGTVFAKADASYLREIRITPDGRQAYIADSNSDLVYVLDLGVNSFVTQITVGDDPDSVAISPDGRLIYVANENSMAITVLDRKTNETIGTLPTGNLRPTGLAISPDGRHLFASLRGWPGRLEVFTLGDPGDTTTPSLQSYSPTGGATRVPVRAPVVIQFSEAMDRLTVTGNTVTVTRDGVTVYGTLTLEKDNRRAYFIPGTPFQSGSTYGVRITTGARDLAGNHLPGETQFAFTTATVPDPPLLALVANPYAGGYPQDLTVSPDGRQILVPSYYDNKVGIVDSTTWQTTWVSVGNRPFNAAVLPGGNIAYVVNHEGNDVSVVDLSTGSEIDLNPSLEGTQRIAVGSRPMGILAHPTRPEVYVVNRDSGNLSILDTDSRTEVARLPLGGDYPYDLDLNADGTRLYVARRNAFDIVDVAARRILRSVEVPGDRQYAIEVTPDETQAYLTAFYSDYVNVVDLTTYQVVGQIMVEDYPVDMEMSADGERLYVVNENSGSVSVIDRRTNVVLHRIASSGYLNGIALSPDGSRIYIADDGGDRLLVYAFGNPADKTSPSVARILPADHAGDVSVVESVIATFNEPVDRATVNQNTLQVIRENVGGSGRETGTGGADRGILGDVVIGGTYTFSADNTQVTFMPGAPLQPGVTYGVRVEGVTDLAGNRLTAEVLTHFTVASILPPPSLAPLALATEVNDPQDILYTSDGQRLLAVSHGWDAVLVLDPATLQERARITTGDGPWGLVVSRDGRRAYVTDNHVHTVSVLDLEANSKLRTITGVGQGLLGLALSPDGSTLYVAAYDSNTVYAVNLSSDTVTASWPVYRPVRVVLSSDGRTLYATGESQVYVIDTGAGTVEEVNTGGGRNEDVVITPDGRQAYVSARWSDLVRVIDLRLKRVVQNIAVPDDPRELAMTPDGRLVFVVSSNASAVTVIDRLTNTVIHTVDTGDGWLNGLALSVDQGRLFLADASYSRLRSYDLDYSPGAPRPCSAMMGDTDCDGDVDIEDVMDTVGAWHSERTPQPFEPRYDLDNDGDVDIVDVMIAVSQWGARSAQ